jgi:hypothetical protein
LLLITAPFYVVVLEVEAKRLISSTWPSEKSQKSQTIFAETPLATSKVVLLSHCNLFLFFLQGVPVKKSEKISVIPA